MQAVLIAFISSGRGSEREMVGIGSLVVGFGEGRRGRDFLRAMEVAERRVRKKEITRAMENIVVEFDGGRVGGNGDIKDIRSKVVICPIVFSPKNSMEFGSGGISF